jgi:hypothetical protein
MSQNGACQADTIPFGGDDKMMVIATEPYEFLLDGRVYGFQDAWCHEYLKLVG